jgi:hypothetical protein
MDQLGRGTIRIDGGRRYSGKADFREESGWCDEGPVEGKILGKSFWMERWIYIKGEVDKGRLGLGRLRGAEGGRRDPCGLDLQTLAGRVAGCQWKGRRGFGGCRGGDSVEGFPQTPGPLGRLRWPLEPDREDSLRRRPTGVG